MYCTKCGQQIDDTDQFCRDCGTPSAETQAKPIVNFEHELGYVLPVGAPPLAIIAGYLGLFSVLMLPAPFALATGLLGLRSYRKGSYTHGRLRCLTGIILGGLFSLLLLAMVIITLIDPEA